MATNGDTETSVEQENLLILLDQNSALPQNAPTTPINATTPILPPTILWNIAIVRRDIPAGACDKDHGEGD